MAGPDTARGMNFQYACAIGLILDFALHPNWHAIQMEGEEDIEDVKIFDGDGQVVLRGQIKQKIDPHQWRPHELRDVFLGFSECPDSGQTEYRFIYAGSEGKTVANELRPVLIKLEQEGWDALSSPEVRLLTDKLGDDAVEFLSRVGKRLMLIKRETWQSVEARDLRELRSLLAQGRSLPLEEDLEVDIYNNLFREVAQRTEEETGYFRRLSRDRIFELLHLAEPASAQSDLDVPRYVEQLTAAAGKWAPVIPLRLRQESPEPDILSFVVRVKGESTRAEQREPLVLADVVSQLHQIVLVGASGAGKTVSLWQLAVSLGQELQETDPSQRRGLQIPLYVSLAGYDGEPIDDLIMQSFRAMEQAISVEVVRNLAVQGDLILLFDDLDLVTSRHRGDLLLKLKSWIAAHRGCSIVVTTHRASDGHKLKLPTFHLLSLKYDEAHRILLGLGLSQEDALAVLNGVPTESRHLIESPLTLRMLAYVYVHSDRRIPRSRSPLYREVVEAMLARSETRGFVEFEGSDKMALLAELARWMQNSEVYLVSPAQLGVLLSQWAEQSECWPQFAYLRDCNYMRLRNELAHSGLLRLTVAGNLEFTHPTFRAYLAALTISPDEISELVGRASWRSSLVLWASLAERDEADILVDQIASHSLLLGQVIHERSEQRYEVRLEETDVDEYFERMNEFFQGFVTRFPALLRAAPWRKIRDSESRLIFAGDSTTGYTLTWRASEGRGGIQRTSPAELCSLEANSDFACPLPIWLLPTGVIRKYHPLEVVYLWTLRSIFDALVFTGWEGGIDLVAFRKNVESHPAVALVTNRLLSYQAFARELPAEVRKQMPFYADKGFDLGIEVHAYATPPLVRYAVVPGHKSGDVSIVQSILEEPGDEELLFRRNDDGAWEFKTGQIVSEVESIEDTTLARLMADSPGSIAQQWLKRDLEDRLPGFPPQAW